MEAEKEILELKKQLEKTENEQADAKSTLYSYYLYCSYVTYDIEY